MNMTVLLSALLTIAAPVPVQAATLDPQHQALAALAGTWSVTQSFWTTPGAAPRIDRGTADFAMILNQRHLRQTLRIADGTGFEGLGYIGFDTAAGQYFSTWMDVNFPGLVVARGSYDAAAKTYVFRGSMSASGGGAIPVREVMTILDRDHFRYEYFEAHNGTEALTVRLEYARGG